MTGTIYDLALTPAERQKLFSNGAMGFRPPAVTSPKLKLKPLKAEKLSTVETVFLIKKCVAEYFTLPLAAFEVRRSAASVAWPRKLAMALSMRFLPHERSRRIAEQFGCDRSLLSHAKKSAADSISIYEKDRQQHDELLAIIKSKLMFQTLMKQSPPSKPS